MNRHRSDFRCVQIASVQGWAFIGYLNHFSAAAGRSSRLECSSTSEHSRQPAYSTSAGHNNLTGHSRQSCWSDRWVRISWFYSSSNLGSKRLTFSLSDHSDAGEEKKTHE